MDDKEFNTLADATLARIDAALDASGADIDCQLAAGGVLEIEFDDGSKIIVNRHGVAREIWVAARSGRLARYPRRCGTDGQAVGARQPAGRRGNYPEYALVSGRHREVRLG